jgi:hypothetical protein
MMKTSPLTKSHGKTVSVHHKMLDIVTDTLRPKATLGFVVEERVNVGHLLTPGAS